MSNQVWIYNLSQIVTENIYRPEINQYSIHNCCLISMDRSNNKEKLETKVQSLVIEIVQGSKSEPIVKFKHT